jgi:hypothetical protein
VRAPRAAGVVTDPWFYERTADGWEIRDENRLLVAVVPDAQHERERDAMRIARAPDMPAVRTTRAPADARAPRRAPRR